MAMRGKYGADGTRVIPYTMIMVTDWSHFQAAHMQVALERAAGQAQLGKELTLHKMATHIEKFGTPVVKSMADIISTYP